MLFNEGDLVRVARLWKDRYGEELLGIEGRIEEVISNDGNEAPYYLVKVTKGNGYIYELNNKLDWWASTFDLVKQMTQEERDNRQYYELCEKIKQLWERQPWVVNGMPPATSLEPQPVQNAEKQATTDQETTLPFTQTGTRIASGVATGRVNDLWLWDELEISESMTQMHLDYQEAQSRIALGRAQSQQNRMSGLQAAMGSRYPRY